MQPIVRVFISSTWLDLQPERLAVEKALQRMHQTKLNGMEYFGSRDETTREVSLKEVDRSDIYVGIIAGRYGSGITKEEYQRASEKPMPRFVYFKDEQKIQAESRDPEQEKQEKLTTWKEELQIAHALGTGPFTSPDDLAARVTADLSNWLLDRYGAQLYVDGVGSLPFDYAGRIENFLSEYLGMAKAPIPFGGRQKELKALDAWLDDPTAPPYFMMAAPAGRGKSALLVRWTRQLLARPNIALVFVPISIRFRTNLSSVTFAALAARLARLHGDKIPDTRSTSVETWRGLVTEYLRRPLPGGEKLLVVLDGLDEAADWEAGPDLFPLPPPDHVRVVVSARYRAGDEDARDWLRRLGWERQDLARSYDLDTLTKEGVALVLESMGFPLAQLGAKVDIVEELYRLTEGDPLLVKLYVEDLWSHKERVASLKPQDMGTLKPGLEGYFDRWWDDQRKLWGKESPLKEQNVQTVLNVVACSLGPLTQDDVLHLTRHAGLTTWGLEEALRPLDRFVIGDGKVHGYVLSHPRLGDYFESRLSASEQQVWQQRFLDWGRDMVQALEQGTLAPAKAPAYIVQYYGAHLEQVHAPAETLLTLVCHGWIRAWEVLEGNYAGFLNDVERAWKAAEHENEDAIAKGEVAPRIGDEVRCALVRASINSLAANMPVELIVQLVKHQKWTFQQGLFYARQIPDNDRRAAALVRLVTELKIPEDLQDQILDEVLASASGIQSSWDRAELLVPLAPLLPDRLLALVPELDPRKKVNLLIALLPHFSEQARDLLLEKALAEVEIPSRTSNDRVRVLSSLLPHVAQPKRELLFHKALEEVSYILNHPDSSTWYDAELLIALAPYGYEAVLALVPGSDGGCGRAEILTAMVSQVAQPEQELALQNALKTVAAVREPFGRAKLLLALIPHMAQPKQKLVLQEVFADLSEIDDPWNRRKLLVALAPYRPEVVLDAVKELRSNLERTEVLQSLAPYRPQAVLAAVEECQGQANQSELLVALVPHVAQLERELVLQKALTALSEINDSGKRRELLVALAPYRPAAVFTAIQRLDDCRQSTDLLLALAPYHTASVFDAVEEIKDPSVRAWGLASLVQHVPQPQRELALQKSLAAVSELKDRANQAKLLLILVPYVAQPERELVFQKALAALAEIHDRGNRGELLVALAPYRPEAVLAAATELNDLGDCAEVLTALAPHQPDAVLAAVIERANDWQCRKVLFALAPYLPKAVLAAAEGLDLDPWDRSTVLAALVPHMAQSEREVVFQKALAAVVTLHYPSDCARVLATLAPYQPDTVLAAGNATTNHGDRAWVLAALLPYVTEPERLLLLQQALVTAQAIQYCKDRARLLTALLPHMAEQERPLVVQQTLAAILEIHESRDRAKALAALAPYRPDVVLAAVEGLPEVWERKEVLAALSPHCRLLSQRYLHSLFCSLLRHSSKSTRRELLYDLSALIPIIVELGKNQALEGVIQSARDVTTWWP